MFLEHLEALLGAGNIAKNKIDMDAVFTGTHKEPDFKRIVIDIYDKLS